MRLLRAVIAAVVLLAPEMLAGQQDARRITILYDAFGRPSNLAKEWRFAALVEYGGRRILFDTGNDARIFEDNLRQLGVDLTRLHAVVILHRHGDRTTGSRTCCGRIPP